jgi:hypothetical protein
MNLMWNTIKNTWLDWYIVKRNFGITTHYDSDMGMGFGLKFELLKTEYYPLGVVNKTFR